VATVPPRAHGGSTSQAAARIFFLLDRLGQEPTEADLAIFPSAVRVIRATSRLAKLDFWLRNPDYLANEPLNDVEDGQLSAEFAWRVPDSESSWSHSRGTRHSDGPVLTIPISELRWTFCALSASATPVPQTMTTATPRLLALPRSRRGGLWCRSVGDAERPSGRPFLRARRE